MNSLTKTLFAGLGSPHGDDQIGWLVADELARSTDLPQTWTVRKAAIPLDLFDWLDGIDHLHLCDAVWSDSEVGQIERWVANENRANEVVCGELFESQDLFPVLERLRSHGSHDMGLPTVLDLAARLNDLPSQIVIWTISARQFEPGEPVSTELQAVIPSVCRMILAECSHA